jgi:hypothetical protein
VGVDVESPSHPTNNIPKINKNKIFFRVDIFFLLLEMVSNKVWMMFSGMQGN